MASISKPLELSLLEFLPPEVLAIVSLDLSKQDLKNLRLTSKTLGAKVSLRLDRVFISANPRNVEVFRTIADHEVYLYQVKEIVWDDTRLPRDGKLTGLQSREVRKRRDDWGEYLIPDWFLFRSYLDKIVPMQGSLEGEAGLSLKDTWKYYLQLLVQQDGVIASHADTLSFAYELRKFPHLKRITLTPAAHGFPNDPCYVTPMIRSFPRGFYLPIPHAWMLPEDRLTNSTDPLPWGQKDDRKKWRGFGIILRQLARQKHNITEFVIDTKELKTGISCRIFNESGEDYDNLVTLLQQPGFKHLDLALVADDQDYTQQLQTIHTPRGQQPWSSFQSGLLKEALENIENPDHVSIRVQLDERWCYNDIQAHGGQWISLGSLIPVGKWQAIRHLGISGIIVDVAELVSVLDAQPRTLRSVELSYLIFTEDRNDRLLTGYGHLLREMRHRIRWRERVKEEWPIVKIHIGSRDDMDIFGYIDYYVHEYLYAGGVNVFYTRALQEGRLTGARCNHCGGQLDKLIIGRRGSPKPSCYLRSPPNV